MSDVCVAGAGVIGLSIAWRAAQHGFSVTITDPDEPGHGASWAAAGMLAPVTEVHYGEEALLDLNLAGWRRWSAFADDLEAASGLPSGYHECGTLSIARDADDLAAFEAVAAFQSELGLDVRRLGARDCRELEPGLAPGVRGGILVPGDHQADNRQLVAALVRACERAGVQYVRQSGPVPGAGIVVIASGAWSEAGDVPIRPVKGQILRLRDTEAAAGRPPLATRTLRGLDCYVVTRPTGEIVVGATMEERGFDTTVTAGAVLELLRAAGELLPGIREAELVECSAGLRPVTPDNAPVVGLQAPAGPIVATGHGRNGILLTPITADGVVSLLETGSVPPVLAPFHPRRFEEAPV